MMVQYKDKECLACGTEFTPKNPPQKYCSATCKGKWKYISGVVTTTSQYEGISGNWKRYLSRLLYSAGRKRDGLSQEILLRKVEEQNYLCAISGVPLTCKLEVGKRCWTNASVDRIEAGGPYTEENTQLVCRGLNSWRSSIPMDEFIWWCTQVVDHQKGKDIGKRT